MSIREWLIWKAFQPHKRGRENKSATAAQNTLDRFYADCNKCEHRTKNFYKEEPCKTCTDSVNPTNMYTPI